MSYFLSSSPGQACNAKSCYWIFRMKLRLMTSIHSALSTEIDAHYHRNATYSTCYIIWHLMLQSKSKKRRGGAVKQTPFHSYRGVNTVCVPLLGFCTYVTLKCFRSSRRRFLMKVLLLRDKEIVFAPLPLLKHKCGLTHLSSICQPTRCHTCYHLNRTCLTKWRKISENILTCCTSCWHTKEFRNK